MGNIWADLKEVDTQKVNFLLTKLKKVDIQETDHYEADIREFYCLRGVKNLTIEQLSRVKSLYKAKLDPEIEEQIKEKYPHLLEKPKNIKESQFKTPND